ncbi:hypothetical protein [Sinorhizobium mexicanum]|uniref:Uncharacterized protein n=1 Tax=Sinorhizobium mexicanum TaxID=375549 RepID=A0A859QCY6_9HYPH|nr:hypothetical protein [Sinorhizobium mexicanum]MBP1881879.1 phosphotransferase system glucose/maltose/N-acetylglucosamine-specific IIC component [Sinorhizobium mexicanum]QLL61622.1 hypothetical protein FKV68_09265 [Sinorhizobium mexicanum]
MLERRNRQAAEEFYTVFPITVIVAIMACIVCYLFVGTNYLDTPQHANVYFDITKKQPSNKRVVTPRDELSE